MSSKDSWLYLSVKEFFNIHNWQGQPLGQHAGYQQQGVASLPDTWKKLSVREFFSFSNWQGQPIEHRSWHEQRGVTSLPDTWEKLLVQEFISFSNWQGQPIQHRSGQPLDLSRHLTLQVKDFVQLIPWEKNTEIGSLPKSSPIPDSYPLGTKKSTLSDLSDLF